MPTKGGRMTPKERVFAKAYAETGNSAVAGKMAGYTSETGPYKALHRPAVLEEIAKQQDEVIRGDLLPKAVNTLKVMVTDERVPWNVKFQASKYVVDYCKDNGEGITKEPHEMNADELARSIDQLKAMVTAFEIVKADKARPVIEVEPVIEDGVFG